MIFVDVSHWNDPKTLDWNIAVAAGLMGATIKYTQGLTGIDMAADIHAAAAFAAKIPLIGAYHFGDSSNGKAQAVHFLHYVKQDWGDDLSNIMLMLDAEQNPKSQMTVDNAALFVQTIFDTVGRWPWIYTGKYGPTGDSKGLPNKILQNCPLLVAAYGPHDNDLEDHLPKGFTLPVDVTTRTGVCRGWQFTDGTINGGAFPGLSRVDQSKFIGVTSFAEAKAIWT